MTEEKIFIVREEVRKLETNPLRAIVIPEKRIELDKALEEKIINEIIGEGVEMDYIPRMKDTDLLFDKKDLKKVFQKLKESV